MIVCAGRRGEQQQQLPRLAQRSCLWISSLLMSPVWHGSSRDPSASDHLSVQPSEQTHTYSPTPEAGELVSCAHPDDLFFSEPIFISHVFNVVILGSTRGYHANRVFGLWLQKNKKTPLLKQLLYQNTTEQLFFHMLNAFNVKQRQSDVPSALALTVT